MDRPKKIKLQGPPHEQGVLPWWFTGFIAALIFAVGIWVVKWGFVDGIIRHDLWAIVGRTIPRVSHLAGKWETILIGLMIVGLGFAILWLAYIIFQDALTTRRRSLMKKR